MTTEYKPGAGTSTPQQMMDLILVQTLSLNMNNAASAQQNAYTVNAAVVSSICTRMLSSGKLKEHQTTTP